MSRWVQPPLLRPPTTPETDKWQIVGPFAFQSDIYGLIEIHPEGRETDLDSVPRLPFIFLRLGHLPQMAAAAVLHDELYARRLFPRDVCDELLIEAALCAGLDAERAAEIFAGVRLGGASHYSRED